MDGKDHMGGMGIGNVDRCGDDPVGRQLLIDHLSFSVCYFFIAVQRNSGSDK